MAERIDLHCHIIPYVDDGAEDFDEAIELLQMFASQGVTIICATPHLRARMFQTPDEEIKKRFAELKEKCQEENIPITLYLSREYHCDNDFFKLLEQHAFIPYGKGNTILCEFSHSHEAEFIINTVQSVLHEGYRPLIAHAERYEAVRTNPSFIEKLHYLGALIQVNAGSITGDEGFSTKLFCRKLAKNKLIDVIGSDAHDPAGRPPLLADCASWLQSKVGAEYTRKIMFKNPKDILEGTV